MITYVRRYGVACLVLLCFLFTAVGAHAQSLRYEKVFAQVSVPDNRLVVHIQDDGHVAVHRPAFMTHAGTHEWQLKPAALQQFWEALNTDELATVDAALLRHSLRQRRTDELVEVTDSDVTRISWTNGTRGTLSHEIEVDGLVGWQQVFPDEQPLIAVLSAEQTVWRLMQQLLAGEDRS